MSSKQTCAVIVTYQPSVESLLKMLVPLSSAVDGMVVVDNASSNLEEARIREAFPALLLMKLEANKGIAAAQNEGIAVARSLGHAFVLLLDQDSVPQDGMVRTLHDTLARLKLQGHRVACVGPRTRLPGSHELSAFMPLGGFRRRQEICHDATAAVECDALMSSGTLIPIDVIDEVGGMEEGLFIDQVDTEWCLRARSKGYRVFGACGAVLEHRLGETVRRFWAGRWRRLPRHKPFRYYYIFRNTILLARRDYVSLRWLFFNLRWLAALFVLYGVFTRTRTGELGMMLKGTVHGMRGVTGKLDIR
jgi:rhamnosyltransferase